MTTIYHVCDRCGTTVRLAADLVGQRPSAVAAEALSSLCADRPPAKQGAARFP